MPLMQKVLSHNSGLWIQCCWFECDRDGYELHKAMVHEHARNIPCEAGEHVNFVFCSENHKMLWVHSHRDMWNLPPGYKKIK